MKARKSRVPSSQATPATVLSRSRKLNHHRRVLSAGDEAYQLGREVKGCSLEEREEILTEIQNGIKVVIPTTQSLAMKANLGIPWSQFRAIRRSDGSLSCSIAVNATRYVLGGSRSAMYPWLVRG